ncbi:class I SAM-dependent methyltransferase [Pontibacter sp. G13]|uniref:class I SAM-dependent methyltransferase n=1 Tax=Pontibacter sp. G13 TaxID=3074898 RepID=UPI00288A8078|nr:class I SAM-dependent methyltransferase [Pontibacter sp. G13]WNJ19280.1 class I SAM-dependent methyltransferase [Pontibacter sp. G13]
MSSRRKLVPFDPFAFEEAAKQGQSYSMKDTFNQIFESHHWTGSESKSGAGSGVDQTAQLKQDLPPLLAKLQVKTLLDAPCGDAGWIRSLALPIEQYTGMDIVAPLIEKLQGEAQSNETFQLGDLTQDVLPQVDLVFCRDCWVHFSFADIWRAVSNLKQSDSTWLLTTHFPDTSANEDIVTGDWRTLNLCEAPFSFPRPTQILIEGCTEGDGQFADKSLGLWRISDLPSGPQSS